MQVCNAEVADIQICVQRDESFIAELQDNFSAIFRLFGNQVYNGLLKFIPALASSCYYSVTSLSNRQTLGEEYAGIVRVAAKSDKPPQILLQFIWFVLFIGGDQVYDKLLKKIEIFAEESQHLAPDKKATILHIVEFLKTKKNVFKSIHRSLFFINGNYYYLSNRITGIKYILLRQWMQDTTYARSFKWLGRASLVYLILSLIKSLFDVVKHEDVVYKDNANVSSKICVLCSENRKNTSAASCGHLFCWNCIQDCLLHQPCCPICRDFIKPSRVVCLQNYV